jgi:ankyrin repeat protein
MGQTSSTNRDEKQSASHGKEDKTKTLPEKQDVCIDPQVQKRNNDALLKAVRHGDTALVKELLDKGADLECVDNSKFTPLLNAVHARQIPIVELLIERGAKIEVKCFMGLRTPLRLAAEHGDEEMVKVLLGHGADPNFYDDNGRTPTVFAAAEGHLGVVKLLLDGGANPEPKSLADMKDNQTPLWWAVHHNYPEIADVLRPLCKYKPSYEETDPHSDLDYSS